MGNGGEGMGIVFQLGGSFGSRQRRGRLGMAQGWIIVPPRRVFRTGSIPFRSLAFLEEGILSRFIAIHKQFVAVVSL